MLYGNLIFIKKTGGDGSKYPVTEKNIKIGRSENCMIRIYTPQVAPEHCQLIIDNSGQAKLRNLFTPTILNGKPLGQGDVTLCHGDVFKLGERLARWEYLPTSKYFKQLLSPTGRLVAVVNPQRRSVEMPGTSATQVSVSKSTPLGSKRKFSEKFGSDNSSAAKQKKTVGLDGSSKPKIDLTKLLIGRHSIKTGKSILKTPTLKQRKSLSGMIDSRTPKNKAKNHRKSTLPSWKVSVDAQPEQSAQNKKSPSKGEAKTPSKQCLKNEVRTPSKSTPIKVKTPKRLKLEPKSGDKTLLNTILESPPKLVSVRSTRSWSKSPPAKVLSTPKSKSSVRSVRLVQSEKKSKPSLGTPTLRNLRKMSLALNKVDGGQRKILLKKNSTLGRKSAREENNASIEKEENEAHVQESSFSNVTESRKSSGKSDASFGSMKQTCRKSAKSAAEKTSRNFSKSPNQNSVKKATLEIAQTPPLIDFSDIGDSVNTKRTSRKSVISSRKSLQKSVRKTSANIYQTPKQFLNKVVTPNVEKPKVEPSRSTVVSPVSTPPRSRKSGNVTSSKKVVSSAKDKKVSPTGVQRKLSSCIFSAERAAKKLKTSSPKKPDKNKRAALLVLGKASRKQLLSQNVKVLLKQKIVKKAIKQSVALPIKDEKQKMPVKKIQKSLKKRAKKCGKVSSRFSQSVKKALASNKSIKRSMNESENDSLTIIKSKISSPVSPAKATVSTTESVKSPPKKAESILTLKTTDETISPLIKFDKSSESYVFDSSRRCSKRLSSRNDTERPDFVELSPTALGLIPKNIEIFKTPKEKKRKSSSLVTPRNVTATGIIKSASTSKIINRKSVSFSSKDFPLIAAAYTPTTNEKTDFDFDSFHTSNITMDVFVSPLNKSSETPIVEFVSNENVNPSEKGSTPNSKKVARKLLESPLSDSSSKLLKFSDQTETTNNSVSGSDLEKPVVSPRSRSSPKSDLTDVKGVKKLFDTPKVQKPPKNDLSDVEGVKILMRTPKVQKSPRNELSDLRGVKRLMRTPKVQKSPRNVLSDLRGVKRLMRTPKVQKSPRNELSDLRGVKRLMRTPKKQKSPKNELNDLRGVKRLMRTPKKQKSPKNELNDLRGVKRLLQSPKIQKSPKNDLTDVSGIKRLLKTPKSQKSPQNNLSDVEGIEALFASPEKSKSRRRVNKESKSSENGLLDVTGVRELFARHKPISNYDVNLNGVAELFDKLSYEEDSNKSGVSETKTVRGRRRKLDDEKEQQVAPPKTRARKESENVKTPRVTRSTKPDTDIAVDIEEVGKRAGVGARKTTRAKRAEPAKKITRKKVDSKKEVETPKAGGSKTLRKRKPVEVVEPSPPKLRRKAAGSEQFALKVESAEPKTVAVRSKTRKAAEKEGAESLKPGGKSKTPTKKAVKGQSKATKSGVNVVSKAQKVQKGRSRTGVKQESLMSGNNISPKKTRSVSARKTTQKTRAAAAKS